STTTTTAATTRTSRCRRLERSTHPSVSASADAGGDPRRGLLPRPRWRAGRPQRRFDPPAARTPSVASDDAVSESCPAPRKGPPPPPPPVPARQRVDRGETHGRPPRAPVAAAHGPRAASAVAPAARAARGGRRPRHLGGGPRAAAPAPADDRRRGAGPPRA